MPVYLFTLHAHGSWLPDHPRGYTRRKQGVKPPDPHLARQYRGQMKTRPARFDHTAQQTIIDAVLEKAAIKPWTPYALATDPTHAHILLGWRDTTPPIDVQRGLKSSITRQLNTHLRPHKWLSERGSRKPVTDPAHFTHLLRTYLPSHQGQTWLSPHLRK